MFENFSEWWKTLSLLQQIYWGIAIPFSLIFVIQMILSFIGGELDSNFDTDHDLDGGFNFFTFKNFVAFFTIFSWVGISCIDADFSNSTAIIISIISGLLMMVLMTSLFYFFTKLSAKGNININNAVGLTATAYLPIKAKRANIGKVSIKIQSSLREIDALTDDAEDIKTGDIIIVKKIIVQNILLVTKS